MRNVRASRTIRISAKPIAKSWRGGHPGSVGAATVGVVVAVGGSGGTVGVLVESSTAVGVAATAKGVRVAVGVAVRTVGVSVGVAVAVCVGVRVGAGGAGVGRSTGVTGTPVGVGGTVAVGSGVPVGRGVSVGGGVLVGGAVLVGSGVRVDVGSGVSVRVGVAIGVAVGRGVGSARARMGPASHAKAATVPIAASNSATYKYRCRANLVIVPPSTHGHHRALPVPNALSAPADSAVRSNLREDQRQPEPPTLPRI